VQTSGLRRRIWWDETIDELLAKNAATRLTLALMYATDFFDQVETAFCRRCVPAYRAGGSLYFHADRARRGARNQSRIHERAVRDGLAAAPDILAERAPETAFGREFKKAQAISYWEAGRTCRFRTSLLVIHSLSDDDQAGIRSPWPRSIISSSWTASQRARGEQATAPAHRRAIRNSRDEVHSLRRACPSLAVDPGMSRAGSYRPPSMPVPTRLRLSVARALFRAGYRTHPRGTLPAAPGRERFRAAPL